ncbi:hypothetical protein COCMIDRAFT_79902 [Bipolaris oryzae ATCC 44560]|uniref:Uncharacterized protein n=1 Tax=Bipolaris oryzae ATCC 44560 TaxID=930090 RepID=W6ZMP7_COCMI|nr:uncharacterized protein COCMIDRAFT_79902 [Bipolaris oryzae ATCC 44560]EUC51375.1 hypothetical protein COCMIDRAFT_79902 [Bipolaris oryzae ATCC 44560]
MSQPCPPCPRPPLNFGNSVTSPCSPPKACFSLQLRPPKLSIRPTPCLGFPWQFRLLA